MGRQLPAQRSFFHFKSLKVDATLNLRPQVHQKLANILTSQAKTQHTFRENEITVYSHLHFII